MQMTKNPAHLSLVFVLLLQGVLFAKPLQWGSQADGDLIHCDGTEMQCYAPGIIRPDQGTIQMTVIMDKPSSELGNDWESLFRMTPAQDIGGNSLFTLMFPQLSYKEKGLWVVARSDASGRIDYGKIHDPDVSFDAGQTVKLALSWGKQLRVYIDGKRVGTAAFNQPLSPLPAVFRMSCASPYRTQAVKISSIQMDDAAIAADAMQSLDEDENTTFLALDALKTAQTFVTPWHQSSRYASATPYWSPASQCYVLGDEVIYPVLTVNQSDTVQVAQVTINALDSSGKKVLSQKVDLTLNALQGYNVQQLPVTGLPAVADYYDLHVNVTLGDQSKEYHSSIVVIPAVQKTVSDGRLAQYLGYHYDFSFDAKPLKQMGVHWVRMWGVEPFLWFNVEPVKGQFQWDKAQAVIKQAKANDLQLLGLLGNMPRWATVEPDEAHKAQHPLANVPARWKPRDMDEWENYAGTVMQRYKDDIQHWEVCNEIDFHPPGKPASFSGTTAEYLQMVQRVYRQSRKVGPDTKVLLSGLSLGGVCDQNMPTDLIDMGVCESIDIFNLHAYQVLHRVDELQKAAHTHKPNLPFWQTEQMWMHISNQEKRLWMTPAIYLWFLDKGFEKFFTFGFYDMYFNRATLSPTKDHYVNAVFQNQVRACDNYAGKLQFKDDSAFTVRHQLRRTDGRVLTVIGSEAGAFELVFADQNRTTAVDLLGHNVPVDHQAGTMKLLVNDMAYILSDKPLVMTSSRQVGAAQLMINGSYEDISGDISMSGLEVGKPEHWTHRTDRYDPKGRITLSREARHGQFAMQLTSSGAGRVYLFEDVKIPSPGDYLFTAHFRKTDSASTAIPQLSYFDRDHNVIKAQTYPDVSTGYQACRMLVHFDQTPPNPVALIVGIAKGAGDLLVDDVDFQVVQSMAFPPQTSVTIPLSSVANWPLTRELVDEDRRVKLSDLICLGGQQVLNGICFELPGARDACVLVASSDWPGTVTQVNGIAINQSFKRMALTHTVMYVRQPAGSVLGEYVIHYADGSQENIPIALDRQVRDWFVPAHKPDAKAPRPAKVITTTGGTELSVFTLVWDNPYPTKPIASIDVRSMDAGVICLLGITGEKQ